MPFVFGKYCSLLRLKILAIFFPQYVLRKYFRFQSKGPIAWEAAPSPQHALQNRSTLPCSPVVTWEGSKNCIFDVSTMKKLL